MNAAQYIFFSSLTKCDMSGHLGHLHFCTKFAFLSVHKNRGKLSQSLTTHPHCRTCVEKSSF